MKTILVINGHPSRKQTTLTSALVGSYTNGAQKSGFKIEKITLSALVFDPILHEGYRIDQALEPDLQKLRDAMVNADHWVLAFPLWHGLPPALVKGFIERTITRGFAFEYKNNRPMALPVLKGKTVRIIITCGMPTFIYHWLSGAPTSKALRTLFSLCGMSVRGISIFGSVGEHSPQALKRYKRYIDSSYTLGENGN